MLLKIYPVHPVQLYGAFSYLDLSPPYNPVQPRTCTGVVQGRINAIYINLNKELDKELWGWNSQEK